MSAEYLNDYDSKLAGINVDLLIIQKCNVKTSLKRKYLNSLSLLPPKWTNGETMSKYNNSLNENQSYFKKHSKAIFVLDTDDEENIQTSVKVANEILLNIGK